MRSNSFSCCRILRRARAYSTWDPNQPNLHAEVPRYLPQPGPSTCWWTIFTSSDTIYMLKFYDLHNNLPHVNAEVSRSSQQPDSSTCWSSMIFTTTWPIYTCWSSTIYSPLFHGNNPIYILLLNDLHINKPHLHAKVPQSIPQPAPFTCRRTTTSPIYLLKHYDLHK